MNENNEEYSETPLVLVFYLDRDMMEGSKEAVQAFGDNVNSVISEKNANIISFFMPTDREERIECINPVAIGEDQKSDVDKMVDEIRTSFDMKNKDVNVEDHDHREGDPEES